MLPDIAAPVAPYSSSPRDVDWDGVIARDLGAQDTTDATGTDSGRLVNYGMVVGALYLQLV